MGFRKFQRFTKTGHSSFLISGSLARRDLALILAVIVLANTTFILTRDSGKIYGWGLLALALGLFAEAFGFISTGKRDLKPEQAQETALAPTLASAQESMPEDVASDLSPAQAVSHTVERRVDESDEMFEARRFISEGHMIWFMVLQIASTLVELAWLWISVGK